MSGFSGGPGGGGDLGGRQPVDFGDVVDKHGGVVGVVEEKLRERGGQVCQPRGDLPYLCLSVRRESGPRPHRAAVLLVEQPALRLGQPEFIGPLVQRRNTCEQFGIHRDGVEVIGERRRQVLGDLVAFRIGVRADEVEEDTAHPCQVPAAQLQRLGGVGECRGSGIGRDLFHLCEVCRHRLSECGQEIIVGDRREIRQTVRQFRLRENGIHLTCPSACRRTDRSRAPRRMLPAAHRRDRSSSSASCPLSASQAVCVYGRCHRRSTWREHPFG